MMKNNDKSGLFRKSSKEERLSIALSEPFLRGMKDYINKIWSSDYVDKLEKHNQIRYEHGRIYIAVYDKYFDDRKSALEQWDSINKYFREGIFGA